MFKVLIVEDDIHKLDSLTIFMSNHLLCSEITPAKSLQEAITSIDEEVFDLVLVDMAIPSHAIVQGEGSPISLLNGGLEVILELSSLGRSDDCVIITQFHEIEICSNNYAIQTAKKYISELLECEVLDCILYDEGENLWKKQLLKSISLYENFNP